MKNILLIFLIAADVLISQYSDFTRVSVLDTNNNYYNSTFFIEDASGNEKIYLFYNQYYPQPAIYLTTNVNRSASWSEPQKIVSYSSESELSALRLNPSKILLAFYAAEKINITTSSNNGFNWSQPTLTGNRLTKQPKLIRLKDNKIGLMFLNFKPNHSATLFLMKSSNEGQSWEDTVLLSNNVYLADLILSKSGEYLLFYSDSTIQNIKFKRSNNLIDWSAETEIFSTDQIIRKIKVAENYAGNLFLSLTKTYLSGIQNFHTSDILYLTSHDGGNTWSQPAQLTLFRGDDFAQEVSSIKNDFAVSFHSNRLNGTNQIYFGYFSRNRDLNPPPYIYYVHLFPNPSPHQFPTTIRAIVDSDNPIKQVTAFVKKSGGNYNSVKLFDDGLNNDSLSNDKIYGGKIPFQIQESDLIYFYAIVEDQKGDKFKWAETSVYIPLKEQNISKILTNKWQLPINRDGLIGIYATNNYLKAKYDTFETICSSGFLLTGYNSYHLWANALMDTRNINNYVPGVIGIYPSEYHPSVNLYVLEATDPPFSQSWQTYRFAVQNGAPFYDGDNDGVYNPVDKNGNGLWDANEDAPEIIGDVTTWNVINDYRMHLHLQFFSQKIEVQISTFSFNKNSVYDDQIFIRYRIINRNEYEEVLDSVIFSFFVDPDIENYQNDYLGCDTTLNLGYTYSGSENGTNNPPAVGIALLQGPPVYIPDQTFIDNNNDGKFSFNVDTPIDSAVFKYGNNIPSKIFYGATNQTITSFYKKLTFFGYPEPLNPEGYRMWQNSIHHDGQMTNPCDDQFSIVSGNVNCSEVNKKFLYSGDPYNRLGWINNYPDYDATYLLSTGPFKLERNVPIDIWGVFVGGRGEDSLHSIVKLKENTQKAIDFYKDLPVIIKKPTLPTEYVLYQNYPNPFNSGTNIKWIIPQDERVTITIYDILGREIEKIVDSYYQAGTHSIFYNANSSLSSGVYFYQLKAGNYVETKKMMYLK